MGKLNKYNNFTKNETENKKLKIIKQSIGDKFYLGEFLELELEKYNNSEASFLSTLIQHLIIWYPGFKIQTYKHRITIKLSKRLIYTKLMEMLATMEINLQKIGFNEVTINLDMKKKLITITQ